MALLDHDYCRSNKTQALGHILQTHAFRDHSHRKKSQESSKSSGGVVKLKDRDCFQARSNSR